MLIGRCCLPIDLLRPNSNIIQWALIVHGGSWWGGGGGVFGENILCHVRVSHYYVYRREGELSSSPEL